MSQFIKKLESETSW